MSTGKQLGVATLGECLFDSPVPLASGYSREAHFVTDQRRILLEDDVSQLPSGTSRDDLPSLELAGPRRQIFFDPAKIGVGIVTCGGLCPGLNDVIRGLVMEAHYRYGVQRLVGFRYGYAGFSPNVPVMDLTPQVVCDIHEQGGTLLGTSRGPQAAPVTVDRLVGLGIGILFVIGGDGTMRGILAIADEISRRGLRIAVVGIPKTIDNDIAFTDRSFGFETAYSTAMQVITAAHNKARGAFHGVALVKLMGRQSGFIACHAALASSDVNFVLIPEVPFTLEGKRGLFASLGGRLRDRGHAVVVVAEGAGQDLLRNTGQQHDASGNIKLMDVGTFLMEQIKEHFERIGEPVTLKYIDPSYIIRGVPATAADSLYCSHWHNMRSTRAWQARHGWWSPAGMTVWSTCPCKKPSRLASKSIPRETCG